MEVVGQSSWCSYPKIYALGQRAIANILQGPVVVEEKVDGSQFSFGVFGGELRVRSKSAQLIVDAPEKMFERAVETARELAPLLRDGWTYRGEYLQKPKHNTFAYDRTPVGHIIGFDVCTAHETYLCYEEKLAEFERLGLETVPCLYAGVVESFEKFTGLLETVSILGGQKIEGFVVKNYAQLGLDGKVLLGKFVSETFKEVNGRNWKNENPGTRDIVEQLISSYTTPARWNKAVQRLRESGRLEESPRDIGPLLKEVGLDVHEECAEEIREKLFAWAWPNIQRGIIRGLPQWYKEKLAQNAFNPNAVEEVSVAEVSDDAA